MKIRSQNCTYSIAESRSSDKTVKTGTGEYRIRDYLGQGFYGMVVRAEAEDLSVDHPHRQVAVKIIKKESIIKKKLDINKEIQIMKALDHPFVLKLLDCAEDQENVYLMLELAPGGELYNRVGKVKMGS
eukprot:TRINITY_DN2522_c0_g1_i3.p1 TRINITY_DN2522_c0_g1~~TRINITY_DN2522_c0_g1_i3.p1  ORF type:complete len:145 (+),score=34.86 TRINITY_DN2522_c0_g1_i3:51-437(+)